MDDDTDGSLRVGWVPLPLRCRCGHEWDDQQPNSAPLDVWLGHIQALRCPECDNGPDRLSLRAVRQAVPRDD